MVETADTYTAGYIVTNQSMVLTPTWEPKEGELVMYQKLHSQAQGTQGPRT